MSSRTLLRASAAPLLCAALTAACHRNPTPATSSVPPQVVRMDSEVLDEFYEEVEEYVRLRHKAVDVVPPLPENATAEQIATRQKALTAAILKYRKSSKKGEIFKPEIETAFRRVFKEVFEGPEGPAILKEIKQGNPKVEGVPDPKDPTKEAPRPVKLVVNVAYPDDAPFSSVPPSLLLKIPVLPPEVRYRFVGRALIARDTEANVILDFISDIVPDPTIPR
jgi:hypothetical protein